MSDPYNSHTLKILELWFERISGKNEIDQTLKDQLKQLIETSQVGSEIKAQALIDAFKETIHDSD